MYLPANESGFPLRISASGPTVVASNNANLLGIFVAVGASTTAPTINLWAGTTATNPLIIGTCTLALNSFVRIPAYCSGGLTAAVSNDHVDVTLFWNPAGATGG